MEYDNAATRLHNLLERGLKVDKAASCHAAWKQLLEPADDGDLLSKLGAVMQLPDEAHRLVEVHHPSQAKYTKGWRTPIFNGFRGMHLAGQWQTFIAHLDGTVLSQLSAIGELLHTASPSPTLKIDEIGKVVQQLLTAMTQVKESGSIAPALKRYLIGELHALIQALRNYRISGAMPVLRQVESMHFHASLDSEYRTFLTDTDVGKHVLDSLNAAAALLTLTSGAVVTLEFMSKLLLGGG
jgi:hypothetical protein